MLWRCAACNPHSAGQTIWKEEIASAFSGYHALGLCGTKVRRLSHEPSCCTSRVGTFRLYEWGHAGKSEHAAGVAIYLRDKVFADTTSNKYTTSQQASRVDWAFFASNEVMWISPSLWCTLGFRLVQYKNNSEFAGLGVCWKCRVCFALPMCTDHVYRHQCQERLV